MLVLKIRAKLVKISHGVKCFDCGSHLDKGTKKLSIKRLLSRTYILLYIKIVIIRTVILPVVCVGVKLGQSTILRQLIPLLLNVIVGKKKLNQV